MWLRQEGVDMDVQVNLKAEPFEGSGVGSCMPELPAAWLLMLLLKLQRWQDAGDASVHRLPYTTLKWIETCDVRWPAKTMRKCGEHPAESECAHARSTHFIPHALSL